MSEVSLRATWPFQSDLTLAAMPNAAYWARRHAEDVLAKWGLAALDDKVQLIVSELVTNAVKITGELSTEEQENYCESPLSVRYLKLAELGHLRLRLSYGAERLLVEVWDKSEEPPTRQTPGLEAEGGRGLFLVEAFCDKWGWYLSDGGGKVIWCEIRLQQHSA